MAAQWRAVYDRRAGAARALLARFQQRQSGDQRLHHEDGVDADGGPVDGDGGPVDGDGDPADGNGDHDRASEAGAANNMEDGDNTSDSEEGEIDVGEEELSIEQELLCLFGRHQLSISAMDNVVN